jgi:hypothetical protein
MRSLGLITKIGPITDGPKPQMGPIHTIPFRIEVQMAGGPGVLELTQDAAAELVKELGTYLQAKRRM